MTVNIPLIEWLTANREKQERVNESLATQLQRSIERNSRMTTLLKSFLDTYELPPMAEKELRKILNYNPD